MTVIYYYYQCIISTTYKSTAHQWAGLWFNVLDPSIGNISSVEMREIYEHQEREKLCVCRHTIRTLAFLPTPGTNMC
jgi:hypothetical protein